MTVVRVRTLPIWPPNTDSAAPPPKERPTPWPFERWIKMTPISMRQTTASSAISNLMITSTMALCLRAGLHQGEEIGGLQRGAADETAVDVGLGEQFGSVGRLHGAAV